MKIEYVEHHGSDLMVANAARRSFGVGYTEFRTTEDGPRTPRGRSDEDLINDLAKEGHLLPFRHPHITLSCDAPIPVARQLGKHQTGFTWSEVSRRYKTKGIELHRIGTGWRDKPEDVRQGSGELISDHRQAILQNLEEFTYTTAVNAYCMALDYGASPEQARFLLPQSMLVSWTWTGSLLAWFHLYRMRTSESTQTETREFALMVDKIIEPLYPYAWSALKRASLPDPKTALVDRVEEETL